MSYAWANPTRLSTECPMCGCAMRLRTSKTGPFLGCTAFPRCKFTEAFDLNVARIARELERAEADRDYYQTRVAQLEAQLLLLERGAA